MSELCERTSERTSEWPSNLGVNFTSILPKVHSSKFKVNRAQAKFQGFEKKNNKAETQKESTVVKIGL